MGQIAVNLPVPVGNGVGTPVDVSAMGPLKTITLGGGATCVVVVEISNDVVPQNWAPLWVFPASGVKSIDIACRWMRATVQQYLKGTPQVDVGGTDEGATFVQLIAPAGDGAGAAVDISALGLFKTVHIGDNFRGQTNIEISEDGVSWATVLSFQNPGQQSTLAAAQWMRVSRNGVPTIAPGLPVVFVGFTTPMSGDRGVAISAGTQSVGTGTVAFANSNGVSFGMSDFSQVTASMDAFRSIIGQGSTATGPTFSFANTNGVTFGISGGTLTASVQTVGGTATGVAISAGTEVATTGAVVFANSNGISFGLNAQTLTATYQAIKTISAPGGSVTNGQLSLANSNNVSFGINAGTLTASVFQPAVQRVVGFTATGGETQATVTFAPAAASSNYAVFGQLAGVSLIYGLDIPAASQGVSSFAVIPTGSMASGDAIKFFLFQST